MLANGVKSESHNVLSGVPQALISLILIGDIDKDILNSFVKSFADDTHASKQVKTVEDVTLQNQIPQLWTIIGSKNLAIFLTTITGICRPKIKNYLIIPLSLNS